MKNLYWILMMLCANLILINAPLYGQDEGEVKIKNRFERGKSIYFSFGPSFTLGSNLGDYSTGFNFEGGFLKRSNKLFSWGVNISHLSFSYDALKTYPYYYNVSSNEAIELSLSGGDVSLTSLGFVAKLNLIPVGDHSIFSAYAIGNPFLSLAGKSELVGSGVFYENLDQDGLWNDYVFTDTWTAADFPALESTSKASGGVHLGLGIEFIPSKVVSFFFQATFSYTLPIEYVSSQDYLANATKYSDGIDNVYYDADPTYYDADFPVVEKGFSAISVKGGLSINF